MDERARFDVAVRVDMQIGFSSRDAAVHILAVVPEIHGENRLCLAEFADLMIHEFALVRGRYQIRHGVRADRDVGENPREQTALANQKVEVFVAADQLGVFPRIAQGSAERQFPFPEDLHGPHHGLVGAFAAAEIGVLFIAFNADGRDEVFHAQHVVRKFFVDQGAVREGEEGAVVVLLAQADDVVLANERLPARKDVHVAAQLFPLADDIVQLVVGEVELVAVFRRPASRAVQVAGGGGVHQNGPRHVAVVFFGILPEALAAHKVDEHVLERLFPVSGVDVRIDFRHQTVPVVVGIRHGFIQQFVSLVVALVLVEFLQPPQQFRHVVFRVVFQVPQGFFQAEKLQLIHKISHNSFILFSQLIPTENSHIA